MAPPAPAYRRVARSSYRRRRPAPRYRRRAPVRRRRSVRKMVASSSSIDAMSSKDKKYLAAQINPFEDSVTGVKIPDANSMPSSTVKSDDYFTLTLAAGESCSANAITVDPSTYRISAPVGSAGSSWTWAAAYGGTTSASKRGQMASECAAYRAVAQAVRITSGLAPTTVTGFVHVALYIVSTYNQATWDLPTTVTALANLPGYKRIPLSRLTTEGLVVVNRPLDCTSQRYEDIDAAVGQTASTQNEFQIPHQWAVILIAVEGVPLASTPIVIEVATHYETIQRPTAVTPPTAAARYSPTSLGAASSINSDAPPSVTDSELGLRVNAAVRAAERGAANVTGNTRRPTTRSQTRAAMSAFSDVGRSLQHSIQTAANTPGGPVGRALAGLTDLATSAGRSLHAPQPPGTMTNFNIGSAFSRG